MAFIVAFFNVPAPRPYRELSRWVPSHNPPIPQQWVRQAGAEIEWLPLVGPLRPS